MVKHPAFVRPNLAQKKRVKERWRKPHGIDSKQRQKIKWAGAVVNKGYRGERSKRGLNSGGRKELYIRNIAELGVLKPVPSDVAVRLQAGLSKMSKERIRKKAVEMGLKVLN